MHRGYIALWRKIEDHVFWKEKRKFSAFEAWVYLLMHAQHDHKDQNVLIGMTPFTCHYGELLRSQITLANDWGWSRGKIQRFLKLLEKLGQIELKNEQQTSRITICNYSIYDPKRAQIKHKTSSERAAIEHQTSTDNNVKNDKNDKNNTPLPPTKNWKTDFEIYKSIVFAALKELLNDPNEIKKQAGFNPGVDVEKSLEKAACNFWATEEGWRYCIKKRKGKLNMRRCLINAIDKNKVWIPREQRQPQLFDSNEPKPLSHRKWEPEY